MNEKIEGCRTFEEDDDNLPSSLWVKVFLLDRFSILVLSVQRIIILPCQLCLCFQTLLDRFRLLVLCNQLKVLFGNPWHLVWSKSMFVYMPSHKTDFTIITMEHMI